MKKSCLLPSIINTRTKTVHFAQTQQKLNWISVFSAKNQHFSLRSHGLNLKREKEKSKTVKMLAEVAETQLNNDAFIMNLPCHQKPS